MRIFDFDEEDQQFYIISEPFPRVNLEQWLVAHTPLLREHAYEVMNQIVRIIAQLHSRDYFPPGFTPHVFLSVRMMPGAPGKKGSIEIAMGYLSLSVLLLNGYQYKKAKQVLEKGLAIATEKDDAWHMAKGYSFF